MNKKIIFFDGDGTLWYPKSTKRAKRPDWVYDAHPTSKEYLPLLSLTPSVGKVLTSLRKKSIKVVVLSSNPHSRTEADRRMREKVKYLKVEHLFDAVLTARLRPSGKGEAMVRYLKKHKLPKSQALLIGDSYHFDYQAAKSVGIDCFLIPTKYMAPQGKKVKTTIRHLKELL